MGKVTRLPLALSPAVASLMRSKIAPALSVVPLLGLLLCACGSCSGYAAENERLLEGLPQFPGSERLSVERHTYSRSEGPADRHAILVTFEAPLGVKDQEIIDFYISALGVEWEYQTEKIPMMGDGPDSTVIPTPMAEFVHVFFRRGIAEIAVNTDGMFNDGRTFEVGIDARGNEPR